MKQKKRIALFGVVAVALILAACGSDSGNNSSESEGDSSSSGGASSSLSLVVSSSSAKFQSSSSTPLSSSVEVCTNTYGTNTVTDCRDNQTYKTVVIGTQTWMAENLNYAVDSSWCYDNEPDSCAKYGRLYQWASAMTASPEGWHLPSDDEWQTLYDYVDANNGDEGVGTSLKSSSGWDAYSGVATGTDRFGFSALPAGGRRTDGYFGDGGYFASFWSATEYSSDSAYPWYLYYYNGDFDDDDCYYSKDTGFSIRYLKD